MTEQNPFDDFLNDMEEKSVTSSIVPENKIEKVAEPIASTTTTTTSTKVETKVEEVDSLPRMIGEGYPPEYMKAVERIKMRYALLPKLNYNDIYQELAELSIKTSPAPTLQILSDEIQKVQAAKDRLAEILIGVIQSYNFKKRAVDILKDSWGKFSEEKNAEGRKGDATFRLSDFLTDFADTEALSKTCDHILRNLDSLHDSMSRRITIWQLTIKLRDIGRGGSPDHDFGNICSDNGSDLFKDNEEKDKENESGEEDGSGLPKLRSF